MTIEEQLHQCRVLWTKARAVGDKKEMREQEKKAVFLKRILASKEFWENKIGVALKKTEPIKDDTYERARAIIVDPYVKEAKLGGVEE